MLRKKWLFCLERQPSFRRIGLLRPQRYSGLSSAGATAAKLRIAVGVQTNKPDGKSKPRRGRLSLVLILFFVVKHRKLLLSAAPLRI
jgi:hypothetical protein